jgi:hypothetical protein
MKTDPATHNSDMKINFPRSNGNRHSKPVFVTISIFETVSFPVRVRCLLPAQKIFPEAAIFKRRVILQNQRSAKTIPVDVVSKRIHIERRVSSFL